ncbi:arginase, hepatic [Cylas formicarius]|uniref:arginase, hepatic n=1 Tax=Cylas formicarius TaxID=197179 RepID=UPI002958AF68|nr:arginase, hepatic [Cylas formicarius]
MRPFFESFSKITRRFFATDPGLRVGILGVPFDKGQPKAGVADGPDVIRKLGLIDRLRDSLEESGGQVNIRDYGNVAYDVAADLETNNVPNMKGYAHVAACNREISKNVSDIIRDGRICITLGGDHSLGIGTVDGHLKAMNENVCVLWVDAHADLNTNKTSGSGNVHGMPMAILAKELCDYWPYLPGMDWQKPVLSLRNVAYVGLRSVDSYERLIIEKLGINAFGMEDVENFGITNVVDMALKRIDPDSSRSIHVSFDIDSLDSLEAPSTGTSVRGGLTLREGIQLMEMVHRTGRLNGVDLVEVNPNIGSELDVGRTVEAAIHVIMASLGYSRKGALRRRADTLPLQTFPPSQQIIL